MRLKIWRTGFLALALAFVHDDMAAEPGDVIKIGGVCDRTGETKIIGSNIVLVSATTSRWSTGKAGYWDRNWSTRISIVPTW